MCGWDPAVSSLGWQNNMAVFHPRQWKDTKPDDLMDSKLRCVFELPSENDKVVRGDFTRTHFPPTPSQPYSMPLLLLHSWNFDFITQTFLHLGKSPFQSTTFIAASCTWTACHAVASGRKNSCCLLDLDRSAGAPSLGWSDTKAKLSKQVAPLLM